MKGELPLDPTEVIRRLVRPGTVTTSLVGWSEFEMARYINLVKVSG